MFDLERAWRWREATGWFEKTQVLRVFHGPGEGTGGLQKIAVDRFGDYYWMTQWERDFSPELSSIVQFFQSKGALCMVGVKRPRHGIASEAQVLFGSPPLDGFPVEEGACQYWIQFQKTRHPGLFLDHEPLRDWLFKRVRGLRILNTFAYTGSLSVSAAQGGAKQVITLDLSRSAIEWSKKNFSLNRLDLQKHQWIVGDVFEWLCRLKRSKEIFDCIILDPPSFSRGKEGRFSTARDLEKLHRLALDVLSAEGYLITSINSAQVSWSQYESAILAAAQNQMGFKVIQSIELPETFPTCFGQESTRYLKGWILKRTF